MKSRLTKKEKLALRISGTLWDSLVQLPTMNDDDINTFRSHIQNIQAHILSRPERRLQFPKNKPTEIEPIIVPPRHVKGWGG